MEQIVITLAYIKSRISEAEKNGYTGIVLDCTEITNDELVHIKSIFQVREKADDDTHYYIISNHPLKLN
jgi:hypothetical protein